MGYTGRIVVARSGRPLSELAAVRGVDALEERVFANGWRSATLDGDARGALRGLVTETGAPALSAYVMDSDLADVEALTPAGVSWHAYLHERTAIEYGAPPMEQPLDEVVRRALSWSAEAHLTSSESAIGAAFDAQNVFVEDTLEKLLNALGITPAPSGGSQEGQPAAVPARIVDRRPEVTA